MTYRTDGGPAFPHEFKFGDWLHDAATEAYVIADAMLAARKA